MAASPPCASRLVALLLLVGLCSLWRGLCGRGGGCFVGGFGTLPAARQRWGLALGAESSEKEAEEKPLSYYAGMLTNPPKEEDEEKDMLTPTLKFIGYGAVVGFAYLAVFVGLNSGGP
ncbi:unnamed protein product [Symbiodinium natans]|uniref:Uncharacterized protein n=1 Tax=Symbiodinium natans TaxID=878477 RepID=A0A812PTA9_9DINO|nr:unnamed protein product [Symbiodinium natans]